jgi:hypothetical protein
VSGRRASAWLGGALALACSLAWGCEPTPSVDGGLADAGTDAAADTLVDAPPGADAGPRFVDRGCTSNADCEGDRICGPERDEGSFVALPGGLCTRQCDSAAEAAGRRDLTGCRDDERCVDTSWRSSLCMPRCDPSVLPRGGCREGWACDPALGACVEGCIDDSSCEPGCGLDGSPSCDSWDDSRFAGPAGGRCDRETGRCVLEGAPVPPGVCFSDRECPGEHECISGLCALRGCDDADRACRFPFTRCAPALAARYGWNETADTACAAPCTVGAGSPFDAAPGCPGSSAGFEPQGFVCFAPAGEERAEAGFCARDIGFGSYSRAARRNLGAPCQSVAECWAPFGRGACLDTDYLWTLRQIQIGTSASASCHVVQCDDPGLPDLCGATHHCTEVPGTTVTYCAPRCESARDCEPGYGCVDDDASEATPSVCVPACLSDADCDGRAPAERELRCELDPVRRIGQCVTRSACETPTVIGPATPVDETGAWAVDVDFSRLPRPPVDPTLAARCAVPFGSITTRERVLQLVPRTSGVLRVVADEGETANAGTAAVLSVRTECELPLSALPSEARSWGDGRGCAVQRVDVPVRAGVPVSIAVTDLSGLDHHRVRVWLAPYRREGEACDPRGLRDDCGALRCIARDERGPRCGAPPTCDASIDVRAGARVAADGSLCWSGERPSREVGEPLVFRVPRDVVFDPPIRACATCAGTISSCPEVRSAREGDVLSPRWESLCAAPPCGFGEGNGAVRAGEACEGEHLGIHMLALRRDGEACDPTGRLDRCEDGLSCARVGGAAEARCAVLATSCEEPASLDALSTTVGDARVFAVWPDMAVDCAGNRVAFLEIEAWADGTLELEGASEAFLLVAEAASCGTCPAPIARPFRRDVRRGEVVRVAVQPSFREQEVRPGLVARIRPLPAAGEPCTPTSECAAGLACVAIGPLGRCRELRDGSACTAASDLLAGWDGSPVAGLVTLQEGVRPPPSCVDGAGDAHGLWLRIPAPRAGVLVAAARASSTFVVDYVAVSFQRSCAEGAGLGCASGYAREGRGEARASVTAAVDAGQELLLWVGDDEGEAVTLELALAEPLPLDAPCDHDSLTEACGAGLICADLGGPTPRCVEDPWR